MKYMRLLTVKRVSMVQVGWSQIRCCKICMNSGCYMAIANGKQINPLDKLLKTNICTWFLPKVSSLDARKKWIVSSIGSNGKIYIDGVLLKL